MTTFESCIIARALPGFFPVEEKNGSGGETVALSEKSTASTGPAAAGGGG